MARKLRHRLDAEDLAMIDEASRLSVGETGFSQCEKRFVERKLGTHFHRFGEKDRKRYADTLQAVYVKLSRSSEVGSRLVFDAIRMIGIAAIGPAPFEGAWNPALFPSEDDQKEAETLLTGIRKQVWLRVSHWYQEARYSDVHHTRRAAAQHLQDLGQVLAGDRRGQRERRVSDPVAVLRGYYERFFKLRCAMVKLEMLPGTALEKAVRAARDSGITEPHAPDRVWKTSSMAERCQMASRFLLHLRYQADTGRFRPPATAEASARQWTAQWAGVTEQSISNLLSADHRK